MESQNDLADLGNAISESISAVELPVGTFAVGGEVPIEQEVDTDLKAKDQKTSTRPIVIRWDAPSRSAAQSPARVSFPVSSDSDAKGLEQLLKDSQPATFGKGGEHVFDESYRKAQKLEAAEFCTSFCPYETGIIDAICQILLPSVNTAEDSRAIRAELYNMNIYSGPSGMFKPHVDTPRSSYQIGSLVICLPVKHEGGNLAVRHRGQEKVFDWAGTSDRPTIQWAAFYSDCEHEVFEVKSGHRVTLTYNLYATRGNGSLAGQSSAFNPVSLPLYNQIKALISSDKFRLKNRALGFYSAHAYPHNEREHGLPFCLKGTDMALYEIFTSLGLTVDLCAVFEFRSRLRKDQISADDQDIEESSADERDSNHNSDQDSGQGSDQDSGQDSDQNSEEYDDEYDDEWNPDRVVGLISEPDLGSKIGDDYDTTEKEMYEGALPRLSFNSDKIIWLNESEVDSKLQIHYMMYGNYPELQRAYSYFAMVVQIPRKENDAGEPAQKRVRSSSLHGIQE